MKDFAVDSMILQLSAMPEAEARLLALEVIQKLGAGHLSGAPRRIPSMRVEIPADPAGNKSNLSDLIVAELAREIRRMP